MLINLYRLFGRLLIAAQILPNSVKLVDFISANVEVKDGKAGTVYAAILKYLEGSNIPVEKLFGLGTDGASVMTGCLNGLAVRLRRVNGKIVAVWCVAHKLALVAYWTRK